MRTWALLLLTLSAVAVISPAAASPRIELITMGPGDHPFTMFGHAALCVVDEQSPQGLCFNYGTADFSKGPALGLDVLRGRADFWVSSAPLPEMVRGYVAADRAVYRQVLPLSEGKVRRLTSRLVHGARPENRHYRYHHFHDNCSTRLRDLIDEALGGALRASSQHSYPATYRVFVREGLRSSARLLALSDLVLGRAVDVQPTVWEAMFLPDVLRAVVADQADAPVQVVYARKASASSAWAGRGSAWIAAGGMGAMLVAAALLLGGDDRTRRRVRRVLGLCLGILGAALWTLAAISDQQELRMNEVLLIAAPVDVALIWLEDKTLRRYVAARLTLLIAVAMAMLAGLLVQPLWAVWSVVTAAMLALGLSVWGQHTGWRRWPRRRKPLGEATRSR